MNSHCLASQNLPTARFDWRGFFFAALLVFGFQLGLQAQSADVSTSADDRTLVVNDAPENEILAFGKNVVVRTRAKGVFAFGGNVIVEGAVEADVATIGGSVIQRENGSIGGDVIVLGGSYSTDAKQPLRTPGRETVVIGVFEEEFRSMAQNPAAILSPSLSWGFVAQRALSILFWFVITFVVTTISPGAVSRAVARFQLSSAKITGLGLAGLIVSSIAIVSSVGVIPGYIGGILGLMMLVLLFFSYVFGRVAMQVSLGKFIQKRLFNDRLQSETSAILIGVVAWTAILSIPYVWPVALMLLFSMSIGLVITAKNGSSWQKA